VPTPEIMHGEFPFRLEYTIDGKTIVVEDVFIAEFQGFSWNFGIGGHRRWNGYVLSTKTRGVYVLSDGNRRIYFTVGTANYYMGDLWRPFEEPFVPGLIMHELRESGGTLTSWREELFEQYDIELISWELSPPIVNSFR